MGETDLIFRKGHHIVFLIVDSSVGLIAYFLHLKKPSRV